MLKRFVFIMMLLAGGLIGTAHTQAHYAQDEDPALVRVLRFRREVPPTLIYFDDALLGEVFWDEELIRSQSSLPYTPHPAGEYVLSIVTEDEAGTEIEEQPVSLQADHRYYLIVYEANPLRYMWIDETATLAGHNPAVEGLYIMIHLLKGAPPLSFVVDGGTIVSNLAYGEFRLGVVPTLEQTTMEILLDDGTPLFDLNILLVFYPDVYATWMCDGTYPGDSYRDLQCSAGNYKYVGELAYINGAEVDLNGQPLEGTLDIGERARHELHLTEDTTLSAELERVTVTYTSNVALRLRIYDESGSLIWQDIAHPFRVELEGFKLPAGTYTFEIGSRGDIYPDIQYRLSVTAE